MKTAEEQNKKSPGAVKRAAVITAALLLTVLAVLAVAYWEQLSAEGLSGLFSDGEDSGAVQPYTYETGARQAFAADGENIAVATTTGLQLLDGSGYTVSRQVFSMSQPAVSAGGGVFAFYDVGGTALRVAYADGEITDMDTDSTIISVSVNDSGYLTTVTETAGYKSLVTVYDSELSAVYKWYSGTGYALSAQVSPDNKSLAVACAGAAGGTVHLFSLSSETEKASLTSADELFLQLHWFSGSRLCAISETRVLFFDSSGQDTAEYIFDGKYLTNFQLDGTDFIALHLSRYRTGTAGVLVTLSSAGSELGSIEVQKDIQSMDVRNERVLVLYSDSLVRYSRTLTESGSSDQVLGIKRALLDKKGNAFLLFSYFAERYNFK